MAQKDRSVGETVASLRRERGWTAQRLADECARAGLPSLTRGTLAKIESGVRRSVKTDELVALARALEVDVADLVPGQGTAAHAVSFNSADVASSRDDRDGMIFISIGGQPNRPAYERSLRALSFRNPGVLGQYFVDGYVAPEEMEALARKLRNLAREWAEAPEYSKLHLFYRGPVALGPLLGRLLASAKPLVVYHHEDGKYTPIYTLDRGFLFPDRAALGG